jgi:ribosomal protein L40E
VDQNGYQVPPKLHAVFSRVPEITALIRKVDRLKAKILKMATIPGDAVWGKLDAAPIKADMGRVAKVLESICPHAVCPACAAGEGGSAENCLACGGAGWLTKAGYFKIAKELRQ